MSQKKDAIRSVSIIGTRFGVSVAGGAYHSIGGVGGMDHTSGSRAVEQVLSTRGSSTSVGAKPIEPFTIDLSALQPGSRVMRELERADRNQLPVSIRIDSYGNSIYNSNAAGALGATAAIALVDADPQVAIRGGLVTFASGVGAGLTNKSEIDALFNANEVLETDLLVIGTTAYIINYIDVNDDGTFNEAYVTTATGADVTPAVDATRIASFRTATYRWQFGAKVEQFGNIAADVSGSPAITSGVTFRPSGPLPTANVETFDESGAGW